MRERTKNLRPTYAAINLDNLAHNICIARKLSGGRIIAVVKADAYGHGADRVARHAYEACGVTDFAVATIAEGISLRQNLGVTPRILVLGYVDELFYKDMIESALVPVVFDQQYAKNLHRWMEAQGRTSPVTLKIDTGMCRLGFSLDFDMHEFKRDFPRFSIDHVMSHLSCAGELEYTACQESDFRGWLERHSDIPGFDASLYSSSAIISGKNTFPVSRPGIMLYGYGSAELKPVMSLRSKIVHVMQVKKGQSVSYGRRFTADKDMWAGVVPIGYADGYNRGLSCCAEMYIGGVSCPVLGTVCMDMTVIDVSPFGENACGMPVEIMGEHVSASRLACILDTIEYEVLCNISARVPRVYEGSC